jgi:hypothetical protein
LRAALPRIIPRATTRPYVAPPGLGVDVGRGGAMPLLQRCRPYGPRWDDGATVRRWGRFLRKRMTVRKQKVEIGFRWIRFGLSAFIRVIRGWKVRRCDSLKS